MLRRARHAPPRYADKSAYFSLRRLRHYFHLLITLPPSPESHFRRRHILMPCHFDGYAAFAELPLIRHYVTPPRLRR